MTCLCMHSGLPSERAFQRIKTWRGLATRYDKSAESYLAGLHLRGAIMWLKMLTQPPDPNPHSS